MIILPSIYSYKSRDISSISFFLIFFFMHGFICKIYGNVNLQDKEIQQYCTNISDLVRKRNYLSQKKILEDLQKSIEERISILENRKNEYNMWFKKYDDFVSSYDKNILDIYKKMDSDSAAIQLEKIDPEISSHILMRLTTRQSSLIMSKMDPRSAAVITSIVANMLKFKQSKKST